MPLEAFLVSIHETGKWVAALEALVEIGGMAGVRLGTVINWGKRGSLLPAARLAVEKGIPVLVDPGTFSGNVDVDRYASWACSFRSYYTMILAPDEPVVSRCKRLERECVASAMKRTLEMHERFYRLVERGCPDIVDRIIPVAQGSTLADYVRMLEWFEERGWLPHGKLVALGSAKIWQEGSRFKSHRGKLRNVLDAIRGMAPDVRLHLLGIHGRTLASVKSHPLVYSADSGAHGISYKRKWETVLGCKAIDDKCVKLIVAKFVADSLHDSRIFDEYKARLEAPSDRRVEKRGLGRLLERGA